MARPNPRKLPAAQAEEALRLGRTKEAVELYKQLLKQEARPEWRDALADAYLCEHETAFTARLRHSRSGVTSAQVRRRWEWPWAERYFDRSSRASARSARFSLSSSSALRT